MNPSDAKRLERLQSRLDGHDTPASPADRIDFVPHSRFVDSVQPQRHTWEDKDTTLIAPPPQRRNTFVRNFFIFSIIFFVLAAGISAWLVFEGGNRVSTDNVDISVTGPTSVNGGDILELEVGLANRNNTDLELVDLKAYFPEGTKDANNVALEQNRLLDPVGTIKAGEIATRKVKAILFGEENSIKKVRFEIEYRVKNSNAIFNKTKDYDIALKNAPLSIVVKSLSQVYSGQDLEFAIDVISNAPQTVRDVLLKSDFGFGFTYTGSDNKPFFSNNLWYLGDIEPGKKKTVTIKGKLEGQDGDQRTFRFSAGIQSPTNETKMEPVFVTSNQLIAINKPFIGTTLYLAGQSGGAPLVVKPGEPIQAEVVWVNNLSSPVTNIRIEVNLSGALLDRDAVQPGSGFYRSTDNTLIWDKGADSRLAVADPSANGSVTFSFAPLKLNSDAIRAFKEGTIKATVKVTGQHVEDGASRQVQSNLAREVRLASALTVTPRITWSTGPFTNTGALPPRVDMETTYTLNLAALNTINNVRAARVIATLPSYVRWIGDVSPDNEDVTFDEDTRQIIWNIGELPAATGYGDVSPRSVMVRIGITPSVAQKGTAPVLVQSVKITGVDRYSGASLADEKQSLTTRISTDPIFKEGNEQVAP